MQALHRTILEAMPGCQLWFLDGKNSDNKTVSNPNIGYGLAVAVENVRTKQSRGVTRNLCNLAAIPLFLYRLQKFALKDNDAAVSALGCTRVQSHTSSV